MLLKKSKALPGVSPHSLEEWQWQALQRHSLPSHSLLLTPQYAALRIQLRYRVYKDKVRALLRKSTDAAKDEDKRAANASSAGAAESALRERGVVSSSMALAAGYRARHRSEQDQDLDQGQNTPTNVPSQPSQPQPPRPSYTTAPPLLVPSSCHKEPRGGIQDSGASSPWLSGEWSVPSRAFQSVVSPEQDESVREDENGHGPSHGAGIKGRARGGRHRTQCDEGPDKTKEDEGDQSNGGATKAIPGSNTTTSVSHSVSLPTNTESSPTDAVDVPGRSRAFVNVMHSSWLLATVEERCAQAAASLGAASGYSSQSHATPHQLRVLDIRHTVLDLLFMLRSGMPDNLHGHKPSSTGRHHERLVQRLLAATASASGSTIVSATAETSTPTSTSTALVLDDAALRRVGRIFDALKSDMILPAVRCLGWLLTKAWRLLFHGLHVDVDSLQRVRHALERAGDGVSVVFTPTHETHLDYLIISYLCFAYGIPLPRIAAGNNLDLPLLGPFLRANGSFFIRRSFKEDALYKDVLQHYVHELLYDGNPIEVFVEGGRSRHGRVCKPRMGFLAMFQSFLDGGSQKAKQATAREEEDHDQTTEDRTVPRDVLLVPISLDYDKVFEVEGYVNQLLGRPKEPESLRGFLQSLWDLLFIRLGHCYVRFGEPVSMRAQPSLAQTAETLATRMQASGTITSTAVLAALLMWSRGYTTREMLAMRARWLVGELRQRGATVAHVCDDDDADEEQDDDVEALLAHALAVLAIDVTDGGVVCAQLQYPTRALELGFYRNHLLHAFLPDMALLGAVQALAYSSRAQVVELDRAAVLTEAGWAWAFLRHVCRHEHVDLAQHLETLVLRVPQLTMTRDRVLIHGDATKWRLTRLVSFPLALHWSFMDSLFLAVLSTWSLRPKDDASHANGDEAVACVHRSQRDVVRLAQLLARTLVQATELTHAEAFCSESIKQALEFLDECQVLRTVTDASTGDTHYALSYATDDGALRQLLNRVNRMRKPVSFLYREERTPVNHSDQQISELVDQALQELELLNQQPRRFRAGVYAEWMAP